MFDSKLTLKYKGDEYSLSVNWALAREVDNEFSLKKLITKDSTPEGFEIIRGCDFISYILSKAGCECDPEEIYEQLFSEDDEAMSYAVAVEMVSGIVSHFIPKTTIPEDGSKKKNTTKKT